MASKKSNEPKKPMGPSAKAKAKAPSKAPKSAEVVTEMANEETKNMVIEGAAEQGHSQPIEATEDKLGPKTHTGLFANLLSFIWYLVKVPFFILSLPFRILFWPFRRVYRKWFGPAPLMFGPVPVDHSDPDFASHEETGMLKSQVVFIMITTFFVIAFYWASHAELDEQVRAEGDVIPPSDVQIVQSRLPGSITEIFVELGSEVQENDVLFRVEDADVQADYAENEVVIASTKAAVTRLQAEVNEEDEVRFAASLITASPEAVAQERVLFLQNKQALRERISVIQQSVEALSRTIVEKQTEAEIADTQYRILKQEYDLLKPLVDAGHEPKLRLIEAETKWRQAEGAAKLARLSAKAMEAERTGQQNEITSLQSQRRADSSFQLVEAQTRLEQAMARQDSLKGRVGYADIRAPRTGVVSALHIKTVGAVVQAGTVLTEIVPFDSDYVVRARLLPQDVADVSIGQLARISLSAYDVARYGALEGYVIHVASNTTEEQNIPPYYETLIEIDDVKFPNVDAEADIVPGMQVTVDIIGGKRTVLDYILSPIQKATSVAFREK